MESLEEEDDNASDQMGFTKKCPSFLNVIDDAGLTPLHHAAESGNALAIHYFLCLGQDINVRDNDQRTPLLWAVHTGSIMSVRYLLNRSRCLVDARDRQGDTALHWCATKGHKSILQLLLESDANPNLLNDRQQSPLDIAKKMKFRNLQRLLAKAVRTKSLQIFQKKLHVDTNGLMRYIVLASPMFIEIIVFYGLCTFPLLSFTTLFIFLGLVLFFTVLGRFYFPAHASTSPITYGHVCGAFFIHLILYYLYVYQFTDDFIILNCFFGILLIPYAFYLLRSHFVDSGHYQGPIISLSTISESIQTTLRVSNFCVTCLVIIIIR